MHNRDEQYLTPFYTNVYKSFSLKKVFFNFLMMVMISNTDTTSYLVAKHSISRHFTEKDIL